MSWFSKEFKKENSGCLIFYLLLFITIPSLVGNFIMCDRVGGYSALKRQAVNDSIKIANLEADVLRATGNKVVHDTVVEYKTYYLGEEEAIHDIYKKLDKIEEYIYEKEDY